MAAELPWILNVDLELRIHKSLQLYVPRKSEQRTHRSLILRLSRRAAEAQQRPPRPGEPPTAERVGRGPGGPGTRATAFVLGDPIEQALVLRALAGDPLALGDPVVAEFLRRWVGQGPEG
ncbi:MAG TPA: hypothetical protein VND93_17620 [Myxococcales bacterium]|nr:hypothetical protein [Myxococcales bacterium]